MSNVEDPEGQSQIDKGKQRAREPSERTPLLESSSQIQEELASPPEGSNRNRHRRLWAKLTTVFLISLSICILGFVLVGLLAWSYASRASGLDPQDILDKDLVLSGPDRVEVLNITEDGGMWVNVKGRIGMDAGKAIGVGSDPADGFFKDVWKALGRWGVRNLDRVSVDLTTITVTPEYDHTMTLVTFDIPPIEVPLTVNPPNDLSWLTPVSTPIFIQPTTNSTLLLHFLKDSWQHGTISVRAHVGQAVVRGGALDGDGWRRKFEKKLSNIRTSVHMNLPSLPGFPHPGRGGSFPDLADLITLKTFSIFTDSSKLALRAVATAVNPAPPTFDLSVPDLPFSVAISEFERPDADPLDVASVRTDAFRLNNRNITLSISGTVSPISSSAFPILSKFITRYLSSRDNKVIISSPLIPSLKVGVNFPSPSPRPQLLRNVTISNMKIKPSGSIFLASGVVQARVILPHGIDVGLDVSRIFPDVLVFDGEVPIGVHPFKHRNHRSHNDSAPPEMPLPDPLPERAFGYIRPDDWLPSISIPVEPEEGEHVAYAVSAKVVDVPLQVLPGRQKEFSNFVGKVVFGTDGATAGILGNAAVTVAVEGLPLAGPGRKSGEIVLSKLPFQGSVLVGKKGLFRSEKEPDTIVKDILHRIREHLPLRR